ncbi:iron-containing alcohol dehydrogenase [Pseudomonas sp. RIT-PI-S]|uniref:iron-containing alcohol dehydrogenase n=1 Tax=Pseudomonas sp. RIT-PI-S TaxID=3035295 RepID=UPI0021DB6237|nr:iron-containing alcohol dehydrogenase [Pseudomonas sp. RIT-PI-S]
MSQGFVFHSVKRLQVEQGAAARLGELAGTAGMRRVLLVSDRGVHNLGLLQPALASLEQHAVEVELFLDVEADPSAATVQAAAERARALKVSGVIGIGGGSPMDVAKLAALLAGGKQSLEALYGVDQASGPRLPLILMPTTAGTGSEVTPVAIVTTGEGEKKGVVSRWLLPDSALLDATLTTGLPPKGTAATGIDAMVHAIEAYTGVRLKNPMSDCLAREAMRLLSHNIERACSHGQDLAAREAMLFGASLAGMAFANSPVAAVHALAYPVGALFHVPHGLSNSLVLPAVLRYNTSHCAERYAELATLLPGNPAGADGLITWLTALPGRLGLPTRLSEVGITQADLPRLAEDAMKQTRLLVNNPRTLGYETTLALYQQVL